VQFTATEAMAIMRWDFRAGGRGKWMTLRNYRSFRRCGAGNATHVIRLLYLFHDSVV
jgi:hypothetical protein